MRAAIIQAPGVISIETIADPTPGPGEVVVEVAAVGLCGTDLHILAGEHGVLPIVPGHEMSGVVVAAGAGVTVPTVGDRVAVDPSLPCGACRWCRRGRQNVCDSFGAIGVTTAGAAADYVLAAAARCIVLPDHVDLHGAALIEPLSCAVRGYDVLQTRLGASVLVYGAGTMGLLMVELAKRTGARSVHVVDANPARLPAAAAMGCSGAATSADELDEPGWDVVVDATGNARAIQDGLGRVATGGTFLQFGVSAPDARVEIAPYDIFSREITITGSRAVHNSFERAAELVAAGFVDWRAFVTAQRPLEDYAGALASFAAGEGLKTQVLPGT